MTIDEKTLDSLAGSMQRMQVAMNAMAEHEAQLKEWEEQQAEDLGAPELTSMEAELQRLQQSESNAEQRPPLRRPRSFQTP